MTDLTDTERAMLAVERLSWSSTGAKEAQIRDEFGLSWVAYYQKLNRLIDTEAALAHDPITVKRLLSRREWRTGQRPSA